MRYLLFSVVLVAALIGGCSVAPSDSLIVVEQPAVDVPVEGGEFTLDIATTGRWHVRGFNEWCELVVATSSELTIRVLPNHDSMLRTNELTVSNNDFSVPITITQAQRNYASLHESAVNIDYMEQLFYIILDTNSPVEVLVSEPWITFIASTSVADPIPGLQSVSLCFRAEENGLAALRQAAITITSGGFELPLPVTQIGNANALDIPDKGFRMYLTANFDTNSDGYISYSEALAITDIEIYCWNHPPSEITSLDGIQHMPNLRTIFFRNHYGGPLDVDFSGNPHLESVWFYGAEFPRLDISANPELRSLTLLPGGMSNQYWRPSVLSALDVTHNPVLEHLEIEGDYAAGLLSLNVSANPQLRTLIIRNNPLTSIDISANHELAQFVAKENKLEAVDFSGNPLLEVIELGGNPLTMFDIAHLKHLRELRCGSALSILDVTGNPELQLLECTDNRREGFSLPIDVTHNPKLEYLSVSNNNLTEIDLSQNPMLGYLSIGSNLLTKLDISACPLIEDIIIYDNYISSIDLTRQLGLQEFYGQANPLLYIFMAPWEWYTNPFGPMISIDSGWIIEVDE
jgi:Leucine-rich repeat (LRR) protein